MTNDVRRWIADDIYYAENDWLLLTWAITDDPKMIGKLGWHGPKQICVEYCDREAVKAWKDAPKT